MRFIYTADLHLSLYSQDKIISTTKLPERLHSLQTVLYNISDYAHKNKINNIFFGGDIFHTKSIIHSLAQSVLLDYIRSNEDITFYVIDGNHDMSSRGISGISSLKCLDNEKNVFMFHETKQIENILFIPWSNQMVDDIKNGTSEYLIAHFGLNEAELSSGISIISDIRLSQLQNYKTCLLGHYHKPQEIGNIIYVGSPIQLDWNEKNEEKRFLVIDTNKHNIESVLTTGYKKHFQLIITKENKQDIIQESQKLVDDGHDVVLVKKENFDTDDINKDFRIVNKTQVDITNRGIDMSMSETERFDRYLEIKEISETKRIDYKTVGIDIVNSCSEVEL